MIIEHWQNRGLTVLHCKWKQKSLGNKNETFKMQMFLLYSNSLWHRVKQNLDPI